MERRARWKMPVALVAVGLACSGVMVMIYRGITHDRRFFEKVRGGEVTEASALYFAGQQQYTEVTDRASVNYFMAALRSARLASFEDHTSGSISYTVHVRLVGGESFNIEVAIPLHDKGITLYTPVEFPDIRDTVYYYITFLAPVPEPLAAVLKRLRFHSEK